MKKYCPKCGACLEEEMRFCFRCGFDIQRYMNGINSATKEPHTNAAPRTGNTPAPNTTIPSGMGTQNPAPVVQPSTPVVQPPTPAVQPPIPVVQPTVPAAKPQAPRQIPNPGPGDRPMTVGGEQSRRKKKKNKIKVTKQKRKMPFLLRAFITLLIIGGVLFLVWFGVGNQLTLRPHSERVVEILNAGSLDLPGTESAYNELPNYIKDVLGEEYLEEDQGPITTAVLPYIHAERVSIHGYFGKSAVTYKISAPDLENWLLNLDPTQVTSEQALLSLMEQYIPNAPRRSVEVTVEYDRQGIFSTDWHGNYYTREFTDAVCGGFNSAYSALYDQAMQEFMEGQ